MLVVKRQSWYVTWIRRPRRPPVARRLCPLAPPVVSTTPPHPEASPDRPGAVTLSRIVARNPGHPEPYTGTRTVLVCSSRPPGRGPGAAAAGATSPRNPPLRWRGPQGTRNIPDNFGSAAGGFTQALGGRVGSKLESGLSSTHLLLESNRTGNFHRALRAFPAVAGDLVNVPVDVDLLPRKSAASWQGAQLVTARPLSFAKAKFEHPRCSAPSAGSTTAK